MNNKIELKRDLENLIHCFKFNVSKAYIGFYINDIKDLNKLYDLISPRCDNFNKQNSEEILNKMGGEMVVEYDYLSSFKFIYHTIDSIKNKKKEFWRLFTIDGKEVDLKRKITKRTKIEKKVELCTTEEIINKFNYTIVYIDEDKFKYESRIENYINTNFRDYLELNNLGCAWSEKEPNTLYIYIGYKHFNDCITF